jgi:hypothetical protein
MAVIDLREVVPGAVVPRGHNRILVMNEAGKIVSKISYATERPLSCQGKKLLLQGSLSIDNVMPEGNILSFDNRGHVETVEQIDAQALWFRNLR